LTKILIMGAGAVGCFVGGVLADGGHQVTLLGRPPLMNIVASAGLTIRWPERSPQTVRPQTATMVDELDDRYDFILVTVKSPGTATAARQLTDLPGIELGQTYLVSFQNGLGNEEQLAAVFGPEKVIAGTITIPIAVPDVGVIEVSKAKGGLGVASLDASRPVDLLAEALNRAGLTTRVYADYRAMKWSKLLLNIVTNASSAILNLPPAQIIARSDLFDLEIEALREGVEVMQAQNIGAVKLPGYPVNWLAGLVAARWLLPAVKRSILRPFMLGGRGSKMPSLHIDLAAGRTTSEIEVLNGAIVQAGQRSGIATPVNQVFTDILNSIVSGRSPWTDYRDQPEKLIAAAKAASYQLQ
jgi:2-dehydropantoate 2-reductase